MKKIFIVISQALLIRNILRSGTLELLKKSGHKLYVFISCDKIPEYIKKEFSDKNVILIPLQNRDLKTGKLHRKFILFTHFLIYNDSTRIYFSYSRHYINRSRVVIFFYQLLLKIFGRLKFLRPLARWTERVFFKEKKQAVSGYFDKYNPDLVFSTSITSGVDNVFMKEAKRRGIKTVSMTKSWDNATKMFYRFVPDFFLTQNEMVQEKLVSLQNFPKEKIYTVGFPQFDWYRRKSIFKTREEHLKSKGLDPNLPVIFFGSQGLWFKNDYQIAKQIQEWIKNNELAKPCQMIVRPHFSNVKNTPLKKLRGLPGVAYDDSYHISYAFSDNWDPTALEIIDFANTLKHSDVIVIILSTIALDAACFGKPIINALFGGTYQRGKDVTAKLSEVVHYQWVLNTNGTSVVKSYDELKDTINRYLTDPSFRSKERETLMKQTCYKVDGKSSQRIADAINDILAEKN